MLLKNLIYHLENIVPEDVQDYILEQHLGNIKYEFASTHKPQANIIKNPIDIDSLTMTDNYKTIKLRPGIFQSVFYEEGLWEQKEQVYSKIVLPPLNAISKVMNFDYDLMKIKSNFNYREVPENSDMSFIPHCDFEGFGGWTLLYYINDSDGDTIIFKNKGINYLTLGKELEIKRTYKPKKGSIIMFNQDYLHTGCPPIVNDYRLVINYNIMITNQKSNPVPEASSQESCCGEKVS
jgi:hypothetical protein